MGLDMYLYKRTYVKNWDHFTDEQRTNIVVEGGRGAHVDASRVAFVTEEVGYWRKANAIHAWFVRECADGVDECQPTEVTTAKLIELRELVRKVLADHSQAMELLPPQAGFFFGSTDVDEWYFADLTETLVILDRALGTGDESSEFTYQASW